MNTKFVPDDFEIPEKIETGKFRLRMLTAKDVDKDYEAVMSSIDHLRKTPTPPSCGDWPKKSLTKEQDLKDLKWHEEKHRAREIFTYTVISLDESKYLGCVYIFPSENPNYQSMIFLWVTEEEFNKGLDQELFNTVKQWLDECWPFTKVAFPGRDISWDVWNKFKMNTHGFYSNVSKH